MGTGDLQQIPKNDTKGKMTILKGMISFSFHEQIEQKKTNYVTTQFLNQYYLVPIPYTKKIHRKISPPLKIQEL